MILFHSPHCGLGISTGVHWAACMCGVSWGTMTGGGATSKRHIHVAIHWPGAQQEQLTWLCQLSGPEVVGLLRGSSGLTMRETREPD